jgi:hypothetical protein
MNKRVCLTGVALALMLTLYGCQLARPDGLNTQNGDRLIGVFITREYLDLFDVNCWADDNTSSLINGGIVDVQNDPRYQGRVYATLNTADQADHNEYVFEDIEGIPFFYAEYKPGDEVSESYRGISASAAIGDAHISVTDFNREEIEGTLYPAPRKGGRCVYANPVYQDSEGRVYLMSGEGCSFAEGSNIRGSIAMEEKYTVTDNSEKTEKSFKVTVYSEERYPAESVNIIQMNAKNKLISQQRYTLDTLPESVSFGAATKFVLIETYTLSPDGEALKREIFSRDDESCEEYFSYYKARSDGFLEKLEIELLWDN